jgi:hypothetical protein
MSVQHNLGTWSETVEHLRVGGIALPKCHD